MFVVVVTIALVAISAVGASFAVDTKEPVRRTIWGTATPVNAPGQTMTLQQVVIDPGAKLAQHFHQGTQLATVRAGVLTYHVVSGSVLVTPAGAAATPRTVAAPGTVKLRRGDSIVEDESLVHYGENTGTQAVVLELAALLHAGAPLSTAVGATPTTTPMHLETTLTSDSRVLHQVGAGDAATYGWNRLLGTATLDGQPVGVEMLANVNYLNGSGPFFGFITFTFADGSTLGVSMQGQATVAGAGSTDTSFASTLGVIGGTGTYVNDTGYGTFTGARTAALGGQVSATFDLQLAPKTG